ncbi:hypothetical protein GCM10022255_053320 [Dactylosporangium darangshiense]|uniref:Uncharacterized protein n=1 Tax=Dactylosporangium darangshiense TaxID=579108 RepID=A0ABP8DDC8_9ACTN
MAGLGFANMIMALVMGMIMRMGRRRTGVLGLGTAGSRRVTGTPTARGASGTPTARRETGTLTARRQTGTPTTK